MELIIKKYNPLLLNMLFIAITMLVVIWLGQAYELDNPATFEAWTQQNISIFVIILFVSLLMILCAMTPLPAEAVTLANGIIFGPMLGSAITWISAMIGAYITYKYSKRFKLKIDRGVFATEKWQTVDTWIQRWGVLGFLIARLVPAVPFFVLNIGAALLPITTRNYLLITGVAITPHIIIICFFGGHLLG